MATDLNHPQNRFARLAKAAYQNEKLTRPNWTQDTSRSGDLLWLNKNENIDPVLNRQILELLPKVKSYALNTYPETAKLYQKLAALDGLLPTQLLLTHGSDGAIRAVFDVFIAPSDVVVHTDPTFAMYDVYAKMYGAKQISFKYLASENGPVLDFPQFLKAIEENRPKLVCLPNPDSPTGTVLADEDMRTLLRLTNEIGSLLLIDEAYFPFYPKTLIHEISEFKNLLVCRSFSKAWGAAGLRVGYLAGDVALIELLHKSRPMYELSTFSSELVYHLLDLWPAVLQSVKRLEQGRDFFVKAMQEFGYATTLSHGNFLHVKFASDEAKIAQALRDTVLYRTEFGPASCLKGYSRFSLGTVEQFAKIVKKIRSVRQ
jgi:histidinol-phosphate aminotransferase